MAIPWFHVLLTYSYWMLKRLSLDTLLFFSFFFWHCVSMCMLISAISSAAFAISHVICCLFLFKKYEFLFWFHPRFIGYSRVTEFPWKIGLQLRSPRQEDHLSPVKCSLIDKSHRPKTKSDAVKYSETKLVWHKPLWGRWISHSQGQSTEQVSGQGYTETHCRACLRKNVRLLDVLVKLAKLKPRQCCEMVCF